MAVKKFFEPMTERQTAKLGNKLLNQTVECRISIAGSIIKTEFPNGHIKKVLHVDFTGSSVGPGTLRFDQNDRRGMFIDRAIAQIWLQRKPNGIHSDQVVPGYEIYQDEPATSNQSGSVTSSISFGLDASAGVFGEEPTANVGASVGISTSETHNIQDFEFFNRTSGSIVHHELSMHGLIGSEYEGPNSLVNNMQSPVVGARLFELPNLAKSNVPIPTQVLWVNDSNESLVDKAQLSVVLKGRYQGIDATAKLVEISSKTVTYTATFSFGFPVDFSIVD